MCKPNIGLTEEVRQELPLPPHNGIKVRDVNGRSGMTAMSPDYANLVVLDVLDGARVPGELVATESLDELTRSDKDKRMMIYNVTDSLPFEWTRRFVTGLAERWRRLLVGTEPAVRKGRRFRNLPLAAPGTQMDVAGLHRDSAK